MSGVMSPVPFLSTSYDWNAITTILGWDPRNAEIAELWRTQPHLRVVVDFLADNVSQIGLHVYRRDADGGRTRADDTPLARLLSHVDGDMTTVDLLRATTANKELYDVAYWWLVNVDDAPDGVALVALPSDSVARHKDNKNPFVTTKYVVKMGGKSAEVNACDGKPGSTGIIRFRGYSPVSPHGQTSKVDALRQTLVEQLEAAKYRTDVWKRGGRVSSVLRRPANAAPWAPEARESFKESWNAKFTGQGPGAGGTPVLEDGMELQRIDFSPRESQFVEAAKLSLQTVASVFHVNPTMIGYTDGATYSNVREFSRMLYTDTLGPILKALSARINRTLLPALGMDPEVYYVEFNIAEKLAGSFEEQSAVLSSSVGRPWMTANEARRLQNLPAIDGGDELVTPLNVLVGGMASPRDTGSQNVNPSAPDRVNALPAKAAPKDVEPETKSRRERREAGDKAKAVLERFFKRQYRSMVGKKGAFSWDKERWDRELTEDLLAVSRDISVSAAASALKANGQDPEDYNVARTENYLRASAKAKAEAINSGTHARLAHAQELRDEWESQDDHDGDPPPNPVDKVLRDEAEGWSDAWGAVVAGFAVGFGVTEAARQSGQGRAVKTWHTTSGNPRSSHASMDGETVPVDEAFSNGLDWPGSLGDPDEVAGCQCEVTVSW